MFWIKWAVMVAVLLVVFLLGVEFSTLNATLVTVHYLEGTVEVPLSFVALCSFTAGVILSTVFGLFFMLPVYWRLMRLRYTLSHKEQTIHALSQQLGRESR